MKTLQDFILEKQTVVTLDDVDVMEDPKDERKYIIQIDDHKDYAGVLNITEGFIDGEYSIPVNDTVKKSKAIVICEFSVKKSTKRNNENDIFKLLVARCGYIADDNKLDVYAYAQSPEQIKVYEKLGFEQVPDSELNLKHNQKKEQCLVRRWKRHRRIPLSAVSLEWA